MNDMNKTDKIILCLFSISVIIMLTATPIADSYIPPTRAFFRIFSGSENVTAQSSMGNVTFIAGNNMTITPNYSTNSITFSSTGGSGGNGSGENNTASNFGTFGIGIFKDKSGFDLRFLKALSANSNLIITSNSSNIIFNATGTIPGIVTGDRFGNTALADLLTELDTKGLIDDQTTEPTNIVYRCTGASVLPIGALTVNSALCLTSVDTGLRVN